MTSIEMVFLAFLYGLVLPYIMRGLVAIWKKIARLEGQYVPNLAMSIGAGLGYGLPYVISSHSSVLWLVPASLAGFIGYFAYLKLDRWRVGAVSEQK